MKRLNLLGFITLSVFASSCVEEKYVPEDIAPEGISIVAEMEQDAQTRTTVEQDGETNNYNVCWAEGDRFSVVYTNDDGEVLNRAFKLYEGAGETKGKFTAESDLAEGYEQLFYAFYPHHENHMASLKNQVYMPASYGNEEEAYTPNTNAAMFAMVMGDLEAGSTKLQFSHLGGVVRLSLKNIPAGVDAVRLSTNKGITGFIPMEEDEDLEMFVIKETALAEDNSNVTIKFLPSESATDKVLYFPLPIGTYQFKVEYRNSEGEWVVAVDGKKDNVLDRAKLLIMPELTIEEEAKVKIAFSDVTSVDAKIKIETASNVKYNYYIQSLGSDVADMTDDEKQQKIDAQIKSATSSTDELPDGGYEGSFLSFYKAYMGKETAMFTPGHTVFVAVIPADNNTAEAVVYDLVTLDDYVLDPESTASVTFGTPTENYTTVSVRITPAAGTYFRFNYLDYDQYVAEYEGDDEKLMKFAVGTASTSGEKKNATTASPYPVQMGKSYMVVVYAYDPATAAGKIYTQKLTCPAIEYNENISLSLYVKFTGVNYAEVEIVPTGGEIASIRYAFMKKADYDKNTTLKQDLKIVEEKMVINQTVSNRRNFKTANLPADNIYKLENLYLNEPDQYLFVIAFDADGKAVHMVNTTIDTKTPFENGFNADLAAPTVNDVYYIANSSGYKQALSSWTAMSTVTDATTLDNVNGMYWLDLDWGDAGEPKRMWLCNEITQNWKGNYALTDDMKANALVVLKKRIGEPTYPTAPDFYGLNATTGALSLSGVQVWNTSEYKALRDKSDAANIKAKTIYLVWETNDGKYGFMSVVPEDFLGSLLYLAPNSNWKVDNARFAAYFFGNGEKWVDMTDKDGDGIYEVVVPKGYPSVIFCRMNPGTTENNWTNKWNQTSDLTVPTDVNNMYTIPEETWDNGDGTWSVK